VQETPSLQVTTVVSQDPVKELHESEVQRLSSSQSIGTLLQEPSESEHESVVQGSLSSQSFGVKSHNPVVGLQSPVKQALGGSQVTKRSAQPEMPLQNLL
jgi:hypothetical protein